MSARKVTRVPPYHQPLSCESGTYPVSNMSSLDCHPAFEPDFKHETLATPRHPDLSNDCNILQIAVIMILLARLVHWQPALAGVLTTVILVPLTALITRKAAHVRKHLIVLTDARVKVCTEVVSGGPCPRLLVSICALPCSDCKPLRLVIRGSPLGERLQSASISVRVGGAVTVRFSLRLIVSSTVLCRAHGCTPVVPAMCLHRPTPLAFPIPDVGYLPNGWQ